MQTIDFDAARKAAALYELRTGSAIPADRKLTAGSWIVCEPHKGPVIDLDRAEWTEIPAHIAARKLGAQ